MHVLKFWHMQCADVLIKLNRQVTAGEVARHCGQSVATAKKYLNRLVKEGALHGETVVFKNGTKGTVYQHVI